MLKSEKEAISKRFEVVDNGDIEWFLGMLIKRDREERVLIISQPKYVETVLEKFGMSECRATPMDSNATFDKCSDEDERFDVSTYQKAIGCLTYLATNTRPDISAAVGILSRFMSDPGAVHWVGIKRILRYLQGTRDYGLKFSGNEQDVLVGLTDSD